MRPRDYLPPLDDADKPLIAQLQTGVSLGLMHAADILDQDGHPDLANLLRDRALEWETELAYDLELEHYLL